MTDSADVVVVGGGIVGCAVAHAVALAGRRCVLLEAEHLAAGTTGASFAWLNATSKGGAEDYHRLNAAGVDAWRALAAEHGEVALGLHRTGLVQWSSPQAPARMDELRARAAQLREWGHPARWIERAELAALEPHMRFPDDAEGLFAPGDGWLDAPRATRLLAARVRALGGEVREHTPALALEQRGGRLRGVRTANGLVTCAQAVLCAGTRIAELVPGGQGARFPVSGRPGLLLHTVPGLARRFVERIVYAETEQPCHVRPDTGGGLLLGADDLDARVSGGDPAHVDPDALRDAAGALLARADGLLPGLAAASPLAGCRWRVGVRPWPSDRRTVAGAVPGVDGLFLAVTHSGITLSAVLGPLMARALDEGRLPDALAPFDYRRFQPA